MSHESMVKQKLPADLRGCETVLRRHDLSGVAQCLSLHNIILQDILSPPIPFLRHGAQAITGAQVRRLVEEE